MPGNPFAQTVSQTVARQSDLDSLRYYPVVLTSSRIAARMERLPRDADGYSRQMRRPCVVQRTRDRFPMTQNSSFLPPSFVFHIGYADIKNSIVIQKH